MADQRSLIFELQEQIRKNIALELHDSVGQSLSSIKFYIEALIRSGEVVPESNLEYRLKDAIKMIQATADEVRRISLELRPKMLDDLGLLATVKWLLKEFQNAHPDLVINRNIDIAEHEIDDDLKVVIYRILQECLNNVGKHSFATDLTVDLQRINDAVELCVKDNGNGFKINGGESVIFPKKLGLSGIRERAELSGGEADIRSVKGDGTRIRVIWENK
jgi:signal transduction histidine kinase